MSIQICTNNQIALDGVGTRLHAVQEADGTRVYDHFSGEKVTMPAKRYSFTTDKFLKPGVVGVSQFEADVRKALDPFGTAAASS